MFIRCDTILIEPVLKALNTRYSVICVWIADANDLFIWHKVYIS